MEEPAGLIRTELFTRPFALIAVVDLFQQRPECGHRHTMRPLHFVTWPWLRYHLISLVWVLNCNLPSVVCHWTRRDAFPLMSPLLTRFAIRVNTSGIFSMGEAMYDR